MPRFKVNASRCVLLSQKATFPAKLDAILSTFFQKYILDTFLLKVRAAECPLADIDASADSARDIDGGSWETKRYAPGNGYWHPAEDYLRGTEVYGGEGCNTNAWSKEFSSSIFD
jgi:hypothetical protein